MRHQLVHLTLFLLGTSVSLSILGGCTNEETPVNSVESRIEGEIVRDLDLPSLGTELVQHTNDGDRDIAIVLTKATRNTLLWCIYRSRGERDQDADGWKLWINHEVMEDGTGAEEPAKRVYSEKPDSETIAVFKSEILQQWSNP